MGPTPQQQKDPTEGEKRANVIRLAFDNDPAKLDAFVHEIRKVIPDDTSVVLRGSAVTGCRWKDGAPFDSDGPGSSDLDLTLVGDRVLDFFKMTGFFVPGVHSRPLSDEDPDIAPGLVPLRDRLMRMVGRPVNIQATRDAVMYFRGELLGQPYLTLVDKAPEGTGAPGVERAAQREQNEGRLSERRSEVDAPRRPRAPGAAERAAEREQNEGRLSERRSEVDAPRRPRAPNDA
jgi:hypothetical protein